MRPSLIAAVFDNTARGSREGEGWRVSSAPRDIATVHRLSSGAFTWSSDGVSGPRGQGFCTHIMFVRSGELDVEQCGHRRALLAGDIFVACAWQPIVLAAPRAVDLLVITLPGWWSMQRFMDNFQVLPDLHVSRDFFAAPIIAGLAQLILDLEESDTAAIPQALTMLADLLRTALAAGKRLDAVMPRARGRMGEILWFIALNIEQPGLSAQDAAASLKCSVRTIYKTCAAHGTSFSAMLTETRLVSAQYQLFRTHDRISDVAYGVGFSSLSHFSRLFRARFGVTAKDMLASKRADAARSRA